jgi:hypothetical protein
MKHAIRRITLGVGAVDGSKFLVKDKAAGT